MKSNRSIKRGVHAFTLIELILSIGIMAIVMIAINSVLFTAMRLRESASRAVEETLPVQQTLGILRRDLQGVMAPVEGGLLAGEFKVGGVSSAGGGRPVDIELCTTTGVMREDEPWSEVQRVTYELRQSDDRLAPGMDLIRCVTRNVLATMTPRPEEHWMMSGVESIQFSCCDGQGWYDTWDTTITTNLPVAVRIRILMANPDTGTPRPIEMVVPVGTQIRSPIQTTDSSSGPFIEL